MTAPVQPSIFDQQLHAMDEGERGMEKARAPLTRAECLTVHGAIERFATKMSALPFSSEDVFFSLPVGLQDRLDCFPNALGGFFHHAARDRVIKKTGRMVKATRKNARGRDIHLWEGWGR